MRVGYGGSWERFLMCPYCRHLRGRDPGGEKMYTAADMLGHTESRCQCVDCSSGMCKNGKLGDAPIFAYCPNIVGPAQRRIFTINVGLAASHARSIRGDQAELQCCSQFIVECSDIPRQAHTNAAEDYRAIWIPYFGKGYDAACLRMHNLLGQSGSCEIIVDGIIS